MRYHILLNLFFIFSCTVSAQDYKPMVNTEAFKAKVAAMAKTTNTITSDFIQEKNLVVMSSKIISKGQFSFKKDNNIRWEYNTPYKYLIIISNGQLYTSHDKNQKVYDMQSNKMFQEMNKFMGGFILGDILNNDKDYETEYLESNRYYCVKLIPRAAKVKQMLTEIDIWFDIKDLTLSSIKMVEPGEDYTKIDFINKKINTEIPLEKFAF